MGKVPMVWHSMGGTPMPPHPPGRLGKNLVEWPGKEIMRFCDLKCPEARFPEEEAVDGAGSCQTFSALYCRKLNRLVHKNAPCPVESKDRKRT